MAIELRGGRHSAATCLQAMYADPTGVGAACDKNERAAVQVPCSNRSARLRRGGFDGRGFDASRVQGTIVTDTAFV